MALPVARIEVVRDTYFGTAVEDPYRWMEDWTGEELQAWIKAQAAYAWSFLNTLPEHGTLLARIAELGDASPLFYNFQVAGGRTFYLRREVGENLAKLVVQMPHDSTERVLFDPNVGADETHTAVDWYFPSRDGQYVAYGISQGGSEDSTLRVLEVVNGTSLDLAITGTTLTTVTWLPDNRAFVYRRFPERTEGARESERYYDSRIYLHRLGDDPHEDVAVFGRGVNAGVELDRADHPLLILSPTSDWMLGVVRRGARKQMVLYAAPFADLSDPTNAAWTKVADIEDGVVRVGLYPIDLPLSGDSLYLLTDKGAPRFKVMMTSLPSPDLRHTTVVVPERDTVIQQIRLVGDYLLTHELDAGISRVRRQRRSGGQAELVQLPIEGTMTEWTNEAESSQVLFSMLSWTTSPRLYRYDSQGGTIEDTGWIAPSPVGFSDIEAHEVYAQSKDGTLVPLSIIHKQGLQHDDTHPTLLYSYGSYGMSITPYFIPTLRAWYERGGIFAVAHVRGGGEYGEAWHKAGQKLNKQNTIDDFIACAEYLIARHYTCPERLAGEGASAGGIPVGGALVQRPDLWAAIVLRVPVTNWLRFELTEQGPPNVPEFGSVTTEEGFRGLQIMDVYSQVQDGVPYPGVLLTTGLNDPRVPIWQATKMVARLQAASTSGRPVLLRVEDAGGHGLGSTKTQEEAEEADKLAFLLQQFGM